ncbi:MAG: helix-hairpin-helix domain-containing protein [Gammaproteobacteria bacterium]|nr:helix-hairpin-helix domain-containing protein [Gammaproteobacteria bacterium]
MSLVFLAFAAPGVAAAKATAAQSASSKQAAAAVNVNTADANALSKLKGVGKKKAAAIVAYRKAHGNFASISDLKNVKGMSQRILDMNKGAIQLSGN